MSEGDKTETEDIVDVLAGRDADVVGKHLVNLRKARFGETYSKLIGNVDIDYTKEEQPDGNTTVKVVIKHSK